jgi:hypothetical protein
MMAPSEQQDLICPTCLCALGALPTIVCSGCGQTLHRECWDALGGCAVKGCSRQVEVKKAEIALSSWGKTEKTCPFCAEQIPVEKLECPYCKASFGDIRPLTKDDVLPKEADPELQEYRSNAKWLLAFSILGCTSPFALLIGGIWYARNRRNIARAGQSTKALIVVSFGICVLYLIMLGLGTLLFSLKHPTR